jgi:hypothetical protein
MTVEAIKEAIQQLPEDERTTLAAWLNEIEYDEWDKQMVRKFAPDGRGAHLLEDVKQEIEAGNFTPLEEGLRRRREQRTKV